jgi:RNA polymerase II subunit A small phosphatase-like protein
LAEFLARIRRLYDVYFFTSSSKEYADQIVEHIAPQVDSSRRFFRDSCCAYHGYYVKDLKILKRPVDQILMVDDSMGSGLKNSLNMLAVLPWTGSETDDMLMGQLLPLLEKIAFAPDLVAAAHSIVRKGYYPQINMFAN